MSKSLFVEYRGQGFWAFDVITSVLLKHLVDVAETRVIVHPWLGEIVQRWRVNTSLCGHFGVEFSDNWSDAQIDVVAGLFEEVCEALAARVEIPAEEIEAYQLLDGERGFTRGMAVVGTKAVTNLGRAIISLLKGSLPPPPPGTWWWYGEEGQPGTIERRS